MTTESTPLHPELMRLYRASSGQVLAALVSFCHDLEAAEDAMQDAWLKASQLWHQNNLPSNPAGWIYTTAKRKLIDQARAHAQQGEARQRAAIEADLLSFKPVDEAAQPIPDERLKLIFTCCHPAINQPAQVALTLKTLCGLSAREIARAYLVSETTMQQRLLRAKNKIGSARIPYQVPKQSDLAFRLESVLAVIYLIYNESYTAYEGQTLSRDDLANEAIRLAQLLFYLLPKPSVAGLLSLMLFHQARSPARQSRQQAYIPLEFQDRSKWHHRQALQAREILLEALAQRTPDKYQLEAAISALHCEASSWQATDWKQILLLYNKLYELTPSPVIKLNALVALSNSGLVKEALKQMDELADILENYQPFYAAKADILIKLGCHKAAHLALRKAIKLTNNQAEKDYLRSRLLTT